jgi:hypothetical protein
MEAERALEALRRKPICELTEPERQWRLNEAQATLAKLIAERDAEREAERKRQTEEWEPKAAAAMRWTWLNEPACRAYRACYASSRQPAPFNESSLARLPGMEAKAIAEMVQSIAGHLDMGSLFHLERLDREARGFLARFLSPLDGAGGALPNAPASVPTFGMAGQVKTHSVSECKLWADQRLEDHAARRQREVEEIRRANLLQATGWERGGQMSNGQGGR